MSRNALTLGEDAAAGLGVSPYCGCAIVLYLVQPLRSVLRPLVASSPFGFAAAWHAWQGFVSDDANIAVRLIQAGVELMLGMLTSLVGAAFFLFLILKGSTV